MEYHDYNVYHQGGNGRPRVALKSARATDFYVEHLSEYEHAVRRRARDPGLLIRRQAEDAARACDEPRAAADYPAGAAPPLVLIPFWGGLPQKGGNAHSKVSVEEKLLQLRGVACSVRNTFPGAELVVGVASAADEAYVAGAINASEILRLDVAHGAHLSFTLFRRVQELIDAGRGRYARVDYVFFTEADQVLRAALSPRALVAALGRQVYVVPNRLEEPFPAGTSKDYATPRAAGPLGQNAVTASSSRRPTAAPRGAAAPHLPRRPPEQRAPGRRGPAAVAGRRPPAARVADELEGVVRAVRAFGRAPYAGSSRERRLRSAAEALGTTFGRCWAVAEKRAQAWFAQRDAVKAADFGRVRQPLKDLSQLSEAIDALKWSPAWHVWALAPANASFSVCHRAARPRRAPSRRPSPGRGATRRTSSPCSPCRWTRTSSRRSCGGRSAPRGAPSGASSSASATAPTSGPWTCWTTPRTAPSTRRPCPTASSSCRSRARRRRGPRRPRGTSTTRPRRRS